jgi:para-nitrobenzyl esterase
MSRHFAFLFALLAACDGAATPIDAGADAGPPTVLTSLGTVIGERGVGYQEFLGIPYAEPPVGDLRWRAPVARGPWTTPIVSAEPPACPQEALGLLESGEEDCLFLNVHTPDPRPSGAPVLVWIHGGAFVFGEGLQLDRGTRGDVLARDHGLVVVSMNYRLGAFGWLAHPALGSTGNEGLLDQQLALEWVRDHIAELGGDPNDVTIAGESAGGLSVCLHLVAPGSRGLFHRAISESGLCDLPLPTRAEQEMHAMDVATSLGCGGAGDVAACLRARTTIEVRSATALSGDLLDISAGTRVAWPSVDGTVIPRDFRAAVAAGEAADVPVVLGWNRDEGTLFIGLAEMQGTTVDDAVYHRVVMQVAGNTGVAAPAIEAAYPIASYPDPGAALAAVLGDATLACPSRRAARLLRMAGRTVHVYRFEYPDAAFQLSFPRALGAFHSAEIQFVFGHAARFGRTQFVGGELALHQAMSGYWARFAATGDPNGAGAVAWPAYELAADAHLVLDTTIAAGTGAHRDECVLWEPP